jgi:hypothetical protein
MKNSAKSLHCSASGSGVLVINYQGIKDIYQWFGVGMITAVLFSPRKQEQPRLRERDAG